MSTPKLRAAERRVLATLRGGHPAWLLATSKESRDVCARWLGTYVEAMGTPTAACGAYRLTAAGLALAKAAGISDECRLVAI